MHEYKRCDNQWRVTTKIAGDAVTSCRSPRALALAAGVAAFIVAPLAHALSVDAGDYVALPPGSNLALLYGQYADSTSLYAQKEKAPVNAELTSVVGIARGVHFMDVGGFRIDPQFLLPFGNLRAKEDVSSLGTANGLGDLILASAVWLVNRSDTNTYFGITPYLYVPTGDYNNHHALNLGENRWKYVLQGGFVKGLTDKLTLDLVGDVTVHGHNNRFNNQNSVMKQSSSYQFQGFLRYNLSKGWDLRASVSGAYGGRSEVNGVDQNDRTRTLSFQIGTSYFIVPTVQLLANYGRDVSVANGFKEANRVNLRILKAF